MHGCGAASPSYQAIGLFEVRGFITFSGINVCHWVVGVSFGGREGKIIRGLGKRTTNTLGRAMVFSLGERILVSDWLGRTAHENGHARHCVHTVLGYSGLGTCVSRRLARTDCWSLIYFPSFCQGHITTTTPKLTSSLHTRIAQTHPIHTLHAFDWKGTEIYTQHHYSPSTFWLFICYMGNNGEKEEF